jgi:conjugal transfer pilus assembly protein TrbC
MMMKTIVFALGFTAFLVGAEATDTQQFVNQQVEAGEKIRTHPPELDFLQHGASRLNLPEQKFIDSLQQQQRQKLEGEEKPVPRALYFLSFSIPPEGIKALIDDAARLQIPATLRGLINNDLKHTVTAMYDLVKDEKRGGIQIDPTAYKTWGITAVPALVVTCNGRWDRIAGNLSLVAMLNKVAEDGDCADVAKNILKEAGAEE